jgi:hypothetical protein
MTTSDIRPLVISPPVQPGFLYRIDGVLDPKGARLPEPFFHRIDHNRESAVVDRPHGGQQADRPGARDGDVLPGLQGGAMQPMQGYGQWYECSYSIF